MSHVVIRNMEPQNPLHRLKRPGTNPKGRGTYLNKSSQPNTGPGKFGTSWANFSCAKAAIEKGVPVIINESNKLIEEVEQAMADEECCD